MPTGLLINKSTGFISGTPVAAGSSVVTISAINTGGTTSATLTITMNQSAPVVTSGLTTTGAVSSAFNYQIAATNTPTGYSANALPPGLAVNASTGLITGTPTQSGTFNATISASNAAGTGSATLVVQISAPQRPVVSSAASATGTFGAAFSYQITSSPTPNSYTATGLPPA